MRYSFQAEKVCLIEEDLDFSRGNNVINIGDKKSDWESCQAFCRSTYPVANYFTYITSNYADDASERNDCMCAKTYGDRKDKVGAISGALNCPSKFCLKSIYCSRLTRILQHCFASFITGDSTDINSQPQGQYLLAITEESDFVSIGNDPLPDCMTATHNFGRNLTSPPLFVGPGLSAKCANSQNVTGV